MICKELRNKTWRLRLAPTLGYYRLGLAYLEVNGSQ